jgi:hypothetical protein
MQVITDQKTFCAAVFAPLLQCTLLILCVNREVLFFYGSIEHSMHRAH